MARRGRALVLVPFDPGVEINLIVVALGVHDRLRACLANLVAHESLHDFSLTCVVNPSERDVVPDTSGLDPRIRVVVPELNLGWAGGLHAGRRETKAGLIGWMQDDAIVLPGWLDHLVHAAAQEAEAGVFGSLGVDPAGQPRGHTAGFATPPDDALAWGQTDTVATEPPSAITRYDWVSSRGIVTRAQAWDDVGGPDPRLYPLDAVDKDYCSHVRCHGWGVVLVPDARLSHQGAQSAAGPYRQFITQFNSPRFNGRWGSVVAALGAGEARVTPHECSPWVDSVDAAVSAPLEELVGREAAFQLRALSRQFSEISRELDASRLELARLRSLESSRSWRLTRPLRAFAGLVRRARRR